MSDMLSFTTSAGVQYNLQDRIRITQSGDQLPSPLFTSLNNLLDPNAPSRTLNESRSLGFFVQETVGINDRLYITGAVRADDNSSFGEGTDILYYPKASASWVVSEEPFWNLGLFDEVRLRGAFGVSGRSPDALARVAQYTESVGPGLSNAVSIDDAGNPFVEPERSSELEAGIDFALLNQRVSGEFTWYKQWVRDALVNSGLSPSEAFTGSRSENVGGLDNWGWEAALNFRIVESPAFSFDLRLSGDHTDNAIIKLSEDQADINFVEGYYYPNVVFVHMLGIDTVAATDPTSIVTDPYDPTIGYTALCDLGGEGPLKFDGSGTGVVSPAGLFPGGPAVPCDSVFAIEQELMAGRAFWPYSWTIAPTFRFLNNSLEFTALVAGHHGRWLADIDAQLRGQPPTTTNGRAIANSRAGLARDDPQYLLAWTINDERWQGRYDASFWKMREMSLRYQLPRSFVERAGIDRASVSVSGRNLFFFWRRTTVDNSGATLTDPENVLPVANEPNYTLGAVPSVASWAMTLRVAF
jgi:outer membrane receptor protein involved in Fe transport